MGNIIDGEKMRLGVWAVKTIRPSQSALLVGNWVGVKDNKAGKVTRWHGGWQDHKVSARCLR